MICKKDDLKEIKAATEEFNFFKIVNKSNSSKDFKYSYNSNNL
jgi:hypothetical protein